MQRRLQSDLTDDFLLFELGRDPLVDLRRLHYDASGSGKLQQLFDDRDAPPDVPLHAVEFLAHRLYRTVEKTAQDGHRRDHRSERIGQLVAHGRHQLAYRRQSLALHQLLARLRQLFERGDEVPLRELTALMCENDTTRANANEDESREIDEKKQVT